MYIFKVLLRKKNVQCSLRWHISKECSNQLSSDMANLERRKARQSKITNLTASGFRVGKQTFSEANQTTLQQARPVKPFGLHQTNQSKTNLKMPNKGGGSLIMVILDTG